MERSCFMRTERIGFSRWTQEDLALARTLWGNEAVTRYICASGRFTEQDIRDRLQTEIANGTVHGVQYWPLFTLDTGELIGCCGLRPHAPGQYELGFHLRPQFWRQGYAAEAARAVIRYAFTELKAEKLVAGHNPRNEASRVLLPRLGFRSIGDRFYAPTGLYHPSYELTNDR